MSEDALKILTMIENGTINAEEGMKLLEAINGLEKKKQTASKKTLKSIRIYVEDERRNNQVDIKLPFGVFKAGVKIGEKFSPELQGILEEINYEEILKSIDEGATGELMNVQTHDGHTIKIYFE